MASRGNTEGRRTICVWPMIGLDSIIMDVAGVKFDGDIDGVRCWQVDSIDGLNGHYFPIPPDMPAPVSDIDTLRSFYRHKLRDEGKALISLDAIEIDGCAATQLIVKARVPNEQHGMLYVAAITIPFRDFSFVLKTVCAELGPTGLREAVILPRYRNDGTVEITASGKFTGWCSDPYDPTFQADLLRNLAEDEKYDSMFPFHPLSRARRIMQSLEDQTTLSDEVKAAPVFTGPQEPRKRRFWQSDPSP